MEGRAAYGIMIFRYYTGVVVCLGWVRGGGGGGGFFFFKQKTAYEIWYGLVGSEMCIRDRFIIGGVPQRFARLIQPTFSIP